jgi:hypothetical protein
MESAPNLTAAMITAAMASDRCYAFPDRLEDARETCTPKGRCKVGWIVGRGGRESWDVWLEVSTGLVKLIRQADAYQRLACSSANCRSAMALRMRWSR